MAVSKNIKKLILMILVTVACLIVYRLGAFIKMPFVRIQSSQLGTQALFGFLDVFTGGALSNFSVLCLGISPYITASIVVQLLQMDIVPTLKEWTEEGEEGKQKLNQLTKYIAIALAFIQGLTVTIGLKISYGDYYFDVTAMPSNVFLFVYLALVATAGTAFALWLAEKITRYGVGNGSSMLIVAGILASFPRMMGDLINTYLKKSTVDSTGTTVENATFNVFLFILVIVLLVVIILGVVFMEGAKRIIPVQYANRPSQAAFRGKNDSNIPIKLNSASVIPVIFAATLMSLPTTVLQLVGANTTQGFAHVLYMIFTNTQPIGFAVYIILIFLFSFFYSFLQMNPEQMAENLQKNNAYVPGIRPGEETASYISRVLFKITMIGATYLSLVAALPIIMGWVIKTLPSSVSIGGTSIIIIIGVALETVKQMKTTVQEQQYRGFLN